MKRLHKKKPQDSGIATSVTKRPARRLTRSSAAKIRRSAKRKLILHVAVWPFALFVGDKIFSAVIEASVNNILF